MLETAYEMTLRAYLTNHVRLEALLERITEEQLMWRATPHALPIAFHVWHMARWADHFAASVPGYTPVLGERLGPGGQIWVAENIGAQWGWPVDALGYAATGMQMSELVAADLTFPPKAQFVAYVHRAFAAAERAISAIDAEQFDEAEQVQPLTRDIWEEGTVGGAIFGHLVHDSRHFGAIECLLGLQVGGGSITV
ncbi:MAG: DinB family protein [Anaerolineales bacterium]|nr:DinB family protein [Anaerolineales bacterium]